MIWAWPQGLVWVQSWVRIMLQTPKCCFHSFYYQMNKQAVQRQKRSQTKVSVCNCGMLSFPLIFLRRSSRSLWLPCAFEEWKLPEQPELAAFYGVTLSERAGREGYTPVINGWPYSCICKFLPPKSYPVPIWFLPGLELLTTFVEEILPQSSKGWISMLENKNKVHFQFKSLIFWTWNCLMSTESLLVKNHDIHFDGIRKSCSRSKWHLNF